MYAVLCLLIVFVVWKMTRRPIYLFYRDTCPHCVDLKPEWSKFEYISLLGNIRTVRIDISDPRNADIVSEYQIKTVPTIVKNGVNGPDKFDGERTSASIYKWALCD